MQHPTLVDSVINVSFQLCILLPLHKNAFSYFSMKYLLFHEILCYTLPCMVLSGTTIPIDLSGTTMHWMLKEAHADNDENTSGVK